MNLSSSPLLLSVMLTVGATPSSGIEVTDYVPVAEGLEWTMNLKIEQPDGTVLEGTAHRKIEGILGGAEDAAPNRRKPAMHAITKSPMAQKPPRNEPDSVDWKASSAVNRAIALPTPIRTRKARIAIAGVVMT
jgi:hypothetical protein